MTDLDIYETAAVFLAALGFVLLTVAVGPNTRIARAADWIGLGLFGGLVMQVLGILTGVAVAMLRFRSSGALYESVQVGALLVVLVSVVIASARALTEGRTAPTKPNWIGAGTGVLELLGASPSHWRMAARGGIGAAGVLACAVAAIAWGRTYCPDGVFCVVCTDEALVRQIAYDRRKCFQPEGSFRRCDFGLHRMTAAERVLRRTLFRRGHGALPEVLSTLEEVYPISGADPERMSRAGVLLCFLAYYRSDAGDEMLQKWADGEEVPRQMRRAAVASIRRAEVRIQAEAQLEAEGRTPDPSIALCPPETLVRWRE